MAVDLRKNKDSLLKAYNDVVADNNDIDWAVFGYVAQTPVLKVVETGEGSIDDVLEELNSSKIMYAYWKMVDPNTSLPKFVFINWQGEAAPEGMKFKCAGHLRDISAMFRPIHVTVNARNEDDMDEASIMNKVAKSSGSQYSIHKEKPKAAEPITAVGSVYKKTQINKEISIKERDKFWQDSEQVERKRIVEERRQMMQREESIDHDRKEREANEATSRDKQVQERMRAVGQQKAAERRASQTDSDEQRRKWEQEQKQAYDEEEARRKRTDSVRKERAAEAHSLSTSSTSQARALFRRKESESLDIPQGPPVPRKKPIQLPTDQPSPPPTQQYREPSPPPRQLSPPRRQPSPPRREPSPPPRQYSPPPREPSPPRQPSPPPRQPSPPTRQPSPPRRQPSPPPREPSPPPRQPSPVTAPSHPATRNLLAEGLPPRHADSDDEQEDTWEDEVGRKSKEETQDIPAVHVPNIPEPKPEPEPIQEPTPEPEPVQEPVPALGPEYGLCVRALFDYQAGDETEITFDPGDIITQVEQLDEGWWTGVGPDGRQGMFPANFVELM